MPRILRTEENIVPIPMGVSVNKIGYVYENRGTTWVAKKNGLGKTSNHHKECIGIALHPGKNWAADRRMYANANYYRLHRKEPSMSEDKQVEVYDEYPERSDCMSVGLYAVVKKVVEDSGLLTILVEVFGSKDSCLLLDLAMYMLSAQSAVFQHYPHWARSHALFSEVIRSDTYISRFERMCITLSKINLFRKKWGAYAIEDGQVFVCYDSTNVNSQADGVFLVQKGHAKDDPTLEQVNMEYAIRQRDGLPITFNAYPGSINDMTQAPEMIQRFEELMETAMSSMTTKNEDNSNQSAIQIVMIADRGYISEENLLAMRESGIGYLMMLKKNMGIMNDILDAHIQEVKRPGNYREEDGRFAITVQEKLFQETQELNWFHIVWSAETEVRHRATLHRELGRKEDRLRKGIARKTHWTEEELRSFQEYFRLKIHEDGTLKVNQRGRGAGKKKTVPSYVIDSFDRDETAIQTADNRCGYIVYVGSQEMTAAQAITALSRRDSVEKVFMALKTFLGMDKLGVDAESAMHTKSLIWFVAAIIHALIFKRTEQLRVKERKRYTVPALVDQFEEVTADKDLESGVYKRRYNPTKVQKTALKPFEIGVDQLDEIIESLA